MKIELSTDSAQKLVTQIFKSIEDETLKTWEIRENDKGEKLLTHSPEQWVDKALFKFTPNEDKLVITISWWSKNDEPTEDIKGYYFGRITEILLVHFSATFDKYEIIK